MKSSTILCVGGGTAGSVIPLTVLLQWRRRLVDGALTDRVVWIRTFSNIETSYIPEGAMSARIVTAKWHRYGTVQNVLMPLKLITACVQAVWYCLRYRPSVIWTAGSFAAVPMVWVGSLFGIPSITIQQDRQRGLANRLMEPFATHRYATIDPQLIQGGTEQAYEWIGVLSRFDRRLQSPITVDDLKTPHKRTILVLGGSSGAMSLNALIAQVVLLLPTDVRVIHSTGAYSIAKTTARCEYSASPSFGKELARYYQESALVVTRAGMNALNECALFSKNTIVIPLTASHQEVNAQMVEDHDAGIVFSEASLTPQILLKAIEKLLDSASVEYGQKLHTLLNIAPEDHIARAVEV